MIIEVVFEGGQHDINIDAREESPNREAKKFYDLLEAANVPI